MKHAPATLEEIRAKRKPLRNINIEKHERLTGLSRLALFVTQRVGTFGFFLIIAGWTIFWLSWNFFAPSSLRFDPYPAFVLWLFISNMIQIMLMPLIMIGQNLQERQAELRNEADLEINIKAEREIETILQHLENQNELILKVLKKLEEK